MYDIGGSHRILRYTIGRGAHGIGGNYRDIVCHFLIATVASPFPRRDVLGVKAERRAASGPHDAGGMRRPLSPTADILSRTSVAAKCQ
jgi:hypothetical protein